MMVGGCRTGCGSGFEPLLPATPFHPLGCHAPRVPDRDAMDAILLVLRTGMQWNALNLDPPRRWVGFRPGRSLSDLLSRAFSRLCAQSGPAQEVTRMVQDGEPVGLDWCGSSLTMSGWSRTPGSP